MRGPMPDAGGGMGAAWMSSSGAVVLHNKWLMTVFHFEYPATMTMMHMVCPTSPPFCPFLR